MVDSHRGPGCVALTGAGCHCGDPRVVKMQLPAWVRQAVVVQLQRQFAWIQVPALLFIRCEILGNSTHFSVSAQPFTSKDCHVTLHLTELTE